MFGLEEKKKPRKFIFDLEAEIKKDTEKGSLLLAKAKKEIEGMKVSLKNEVSSEELENYGILLHGYHALQKVLKKTIQNSKT